MKNPFVMMAALMAAMSAAFRENSYRNAGLSLPTSRTRSRLKGPKHPAGSKQLIRFYKAKHGVKPDSLDEAIRWYAGYRSSEDAATRQREQKRRTERVERKHRLPLAA